MNEKDNLNEEEENYEDDLETQGDEIINELYKVDEFLLESLPISDVSKQFSIYEYPMIEATNKMYGMAQSLVEATNKAYRLAQPMIETTNKMYEVARPMIEAQNSAYEYMRPLIEAHERVYKQIQPIIEMYNTIDWDSMREAVAIQLKEIEGILFEYEKDYWCLDIDSMSVLIDEENTNFNLVEYVDEKLELYVQELIKDPMYKLHATLIEETYTAYKAGLYKLCVMPLFATFEHVIALWYMGKIQGEEISVNQRPEVKKLYYKIKPEKYNEDFDVEQVTLKTIFALPILRFYKSTFVRIPKELCQGLNRNSIAHGYHDYDSLTKEDILKLFQLLKSSLILKDLNPDKLAES